MDTRTEEDSSPSVCDCSKVPSLKPSRKVRQGDGDTPPHRPILVSFATTHRFPNPGVFRVSRIARETPHVPTPPPLRHWHGGVASSQPPGSV